MIQFVVRMTASLLGLSAALVIIGIFDAFLGWDIFSRNVEAVLYGVFFSCITLACAGLALSFVLGIHEIVLLLRASQEGAPVLPRRSTDSLFKAVSVAAVGMALILLALGLANRQVQRHRSSVFQDLAQEQAARFAPKVTPYLPTVAETPEVGPELAQAMSTLQNLDLFQRPSLYLADVKDPDAIWIYVQGWDQKPSHFERRYAAKVHELAIVAALRGDTQPLDRFNATAHLAWLQKIEGSSGVAAVLHLVGDENENFRAYSK